MPAQSVYQADTLGDLTAGHICAFVPIFWLRPPLWLLRFVDWTHRQASLVQSDQTSDAFRLTSQGNQELVLAEAKHRPVIIFRTPPPRAKSVPVIPIFSFAEHKNQAFLDNVRASRYPGKFYLPPSEEFGVKESYASFELIQPLDTGFLSSDTRIARITPTAQGTLTR